MVKKSKIKRGVCCECEERERVEGAVESDW